MSTSSVGGKNLNTALRVTHVIPSDIYYIIFIKKSIFFVYDEYVLIKKFGIVLNEP